jgi:hypothetical protein
MSEQKSEEIMNCKRKLLFTGRKAMPLCAVLVVSGVLLLPGNGNAQNIIMDDGGSTATINPGGGTGNLGMNNWSVLGGQNQLNQQWFWYSIGGVTAQPINTIGGLTVTPNAYGLDGLNDVTVTYANSQLSVNVEYVLSGNGASSGSADMEEYLSIKNTGTSPFSLNFYQYSNFNLLGQPNTVNISGIPFDPSNPFSGYTGATQTTGGLGGNGIAEVIDVPYANYAEAATLGQTLGELGAGPYTLNDNTGPVTGDVTWAFEWNAMLNPGEMLDITKDKGLSVQIVPEPSTIALMVFGLASLGLARRRQSF